MNTNFGPKIKQLRTQRKMTQLDLANRLGVSKTIMSAYETGLRKPSYDVLMEIALFFNVSMDYLFDCGEEGNEHTVDLSDLSEEERNLILGIVDSFKQNNNLIKMLMKNETLHFNLSMSEDEVAGLVKFKDKKEKND